MDSPRLLFALEPEAAAINCRQWLEKSKNVVMAKGNSMLAIQLRGAFCLSLDLLFSLLTFLSFICPFCFPFDLFRCPVLFV